jgi:hypothetical protein
VLIQLLLSWPLFIKTNNYEKIFTINNHYYCRISLSAQIPTSGLMAKWSFDGDLTADSHGSYTLTNNGATLSDGFQSAPNTAALFMVLQ